MKKSLGQVIEDLLLKQGIKCSEEDVLNAIKQIKKEEVVQFVK